ncbi:DUF5591 domain-containing protein [Methanogenium cariaci]|uniref:DUF5591 domain-containing protein n=1 Tax=Methanogenium cariaci TaxID=2197 RepID=UPI00078596C9|nr:DUF5591 domain-containing protein [Methanogenium cariaci]
MSEKIRINHEPNSRRLLDPPFYLREFEEAFRYIIDEYHIPPHDIGVFIPCAVRKPYSTSPSHRLFHKILNSVYADTSYHVAIFGTCGTVPAELECMYPPYAQYHYMLGKCTNQRIKDDFLKIETYRLTEFLEKTADTYQLRIAYCIGAFRRAMARAAAKTGTDILIYPTDPMIERMYNDDCPFPEGSLSMQEYIDEFTEGGLLRAKGGMVDRLEK